MSINEHTEALLVSAADAALKSGKEIAPKAPRRRLTQHKGGDDDDGGDDDEFNYWRLRDPQGAKHRQRQSRSAQKTTSRVSQSDQAPGGQTASRCSTRPR